jgi:hypothetical protein
MLTVTYAECHIKVLYADGRYAECHYTEWRGALSSTVSSSRGLYYKIFNGGNNYS